MREMLVLPLGDSLSVNALREGLRVSFPQKLEDVEEVELRPITAEECEECRYPEMPSRRTTGIAVVGRRKDGASGLNDEVVALGSTVDCRGGSPWNERRVSA